MKLVANYKRIIVILFAAVLFVGCAEQGKKSGGGSPTETGGVPYVPPGGSVSETPSDYWKDGATVNFVVEGATELDRIERLSDYTGRGMNNPTDIKLNVNLEKRGGGYGGRIAIRYTDDGSYHEGVFVNGDTSSFPNTSESKAARYNVWFTPSGQSNFVFHGFFQDFQGGVILVVDEIDDEALGDGEVPTSYSGSVWYKNFDLGGSAAPHPPTHCFFVSIGPYDCRAWKSGDGVNTTAAVTPGNGYKKLGTFSGLKTSDGFN